MTGYAIRPLERCDWQDVPARSGAVDGWCWASHDGLEVGASPPASIVPTGWLWGWGADRWLRWRIDPRHGCVGSELYAGEPGEGAELARVSGADGTWSPFLLPVAQIRWSPSARRGGELRVVQVITPSSIAFVAWTPRTADGR